MAKNNSKKIYFVCNKIFPLLIVVATLFMGIGYAALSSITLDIEGSLVAEVQDGVFISEVNYVSNSNADLNSSEILKYYDTILNSNVVLSNNETDSTITYRITINNNTDKDYYFVRTYYENDVKFYSNNNITFELEGLNFGDVLNKGNHITFNITFKYIDTLESVNDSINTLNSYINFEFEPTSSVFLVTGLEFNNLVKTGNYIAHENLTSTTTEDSDIKKIVFGKFSDYADIVSNITPEPIDKYRTGSANLYRYLDTDSKYIAYILSDSGDFFINQNASRMFNNFLSLTEITNISLLKAKYTHSMNNMFSNCKNITDLILTNFNAISITDIESMFANCENLINIDLSSLDIRNITSLKSLFSGCLKLTDISSIAEWNVSKVKNMYGLFLNCVNLSDISPLANWNTSSVERLRMTFSLQTAVFNTYGTGKIEDLTPLANWDTSSVYDMQQTFKGQGIKNSKGIENWDTSAVTTMEMMFQYCSNLEYLNLCSYNISASTNINATFANTPKLTVVYVGPGWMINEIDSTTFSNSLIKNVTKLDTCSTE